MYVCVCVCVCVCVYLNADNSHDDVVIVCAAPAQDVGSFFISLLTKFMNSILCAVKRQQTEQVAELLSWRQLIQTNTK